MWDIRRFAKLDKFPRDRRIVIQFRFADARPRERGGGSSSKMEAPICAATIPVTKLTLIVESSVRALTDVWSGEREPATVLRSKELHVTGPSGDAKRLWDWLGRSAFAATRSQRRATA